MSRTAERVKLMIRGADILGDASMDAFDIACQPDVWGFC
jgi:hypothetical protein